MTGRPRWWQQALAATSAGILLALVPAPAAWAHGAHAPAATNYRGQVTGVTPALTGVSVRMIEAGTGLELTNRVDEPVWVLGYDGEPYLEVRADGVYENVHSPATYLNREPTATAPLPARADPAAEPSWRRVSGGPVVRWYDRRTTWTEAGPPPVPAGAGPHPIREWTVPLARGDTRAAVTGTLEWVPPPSPWPWWAAAVLAAAAVGALGLLGHSRVARAGVGAAAVAGGGAALAYAAAREVDAGARHPGEVLGWLVTGQAWASLSAVAATVAGGWLLVRAVRQEAPGDGAGFALALSGTCLALFAGLADAAVLARSVAPVPFDPLWARMAVTTVLAAGAGMLLAGALTLRRLRVRGPAGPG